MGALNGGSLLASGPPKPTGRGTGVSIIVDFRPD
jgi:hypothetical protein